MKVYNLQRGTGKTWRLILLSEVTGYPIVTFNEVMAKAIEDQAKRMNAIIPKPVSVSKLCDKGFDHKDILVDEASFCLEKLFGMIGCTVHAATMTEPMQEPYMA